MFKTYKTTHTTYYRTTLYWLTFKHISIYKTLNIIHTNVYNNTNQNPVDIHYRITI